MLVASEIVDMHDCSQCCHRTASIFQLNHHIRRNHKNVYAAELFHAIVEPEQFSCICCDYKSYHQFDLYEHWKQAHNPRAENNEEGSFCDNTTRYGCDLCKYASDSPLSFIKHGEFTQCSYRPALDFQLDYHIRRNHSNVYATELFHAIVEPEQFSCIRCAYTTWYRFELYEHYKQSHNPRTESNAIVSYNEKSVRYQCDHCRCKSDSGLVLMVLHNDLCEFVPVRLSQEVNRPSVALKDKGLKSSTSTHHLDEETNWFQCYHCSYRTKRKSDLKKHMLKHATDEEIDWLQCLHCSHRAKDKPRWEKHMLQCAANKEIKWLPCNKCKFRTKKKPKFEKHRLLCAANKKKNWLPCNKCSYRTINKPKLEKHMLRCRCVANKEINWLSCNKCSYRTKKMSKLEKHRLQCAAKKKIKWLPCSKCSYRTKSKPKFEKHMLRCAANKEIRPSVPLKDKRLKSNTSTHHLEERNELVPVPSM